MSTEHPTDQAVEPNGRPPAESIRVSTLELFFDLVFVFTVTQLTGVLVDDLTLTSVGEVLLMLGVIWWMYAGYSWLTNAVAPNSTTRRTLLLVGMVGFLLMALAIPDAFGESGWLFGISYVVVNVVHAALFLRAGPDAARAIRWLGSLNLCSAGLVLLGGFLPEPWRQVCWAAALALQIATPYLHPIGMMSIAPGHFVERHGLVVIVAIGESVVAIGLGFGGVHLGLGAILVAALGLTIAYYLWWLYFAGDDVRAEHALAAATDPLRRSRLALHGWGYAHFPMILGIVVLAVGIKKTVGHAFEPLHWGQAIALSTGVALYLLGHAWFVRLLRLNGWQHRVVAAALVLAVIPLGHLVAIAQLAAVPLIMAAAAIIEDIPAIRREGSTAIGDFGRTGS